MDLKEYAITIIDKAEKAAEVDKDTNEAVRLLMLLSDVLLEQCKKLVTGKV